MAGQLVLGCFDKCNTATKTIQASTVEVVVGGLGCALGRPYSYILSVEQWFSNWGMRGDGGGY